MLAIFHLVVARIRAFLRPGAFAREFDQEMAAHLAMAEEEKIRRGMTRQQARRMARVELGGLTQLREASREARGLPWLDTFWLDIKLGLRMLRKSWGLTLVGGLAMTVAIIIGVVVFTFLDLAFGGTLPLDEGDRVVALATWDEKAQRRHPTSRDDLGRWRDALRSVADIGAFHTIERNLIIGDGSTEPGSGLAEPVLIAEMTASGFQLARVPPLLGRTLVEDDERAGAVPVVVIGHDVWQSRFLGDRAVVGQTVRLGNTVHTVVGVMPEGFGFPVNHRFWTPLRTDRSDPLPAAPEASVFARLAPGVTIESAQAELTTLGLLPPVARFLNAGAQETGQELHARVVPYIFAFAGDSDRGQIRWVVRLVLVLVALLLVPPCANIAILVYARTITRQEEFAARYALGASRGRIVGQLFVEMLVLAAGAAGAALIVVHLSLGWAEANLVDPSSGGIPFWIDFSLSFQTVLFAAGLAVVAALIAGLVPALKATGRRMQSGLHTLGNRTGVQLGATWSALVVAQVAISLAALPAAVEIGWGTVRKGILGPGFAAEEYLTARLAMDRVTLASSLAEVDVAEGDARPFAARFAALQTELVRSLEAEPGVLGVTVSALPGDEPWERIEIDRGPQPEDEIRPSRSLVRVNRVDDAFFEVFDIPLLTGRTFGPGDFDSGRTVVIVNRTIAEQLVGDGNPLGRRIRFLRDEGTSGRGTSGTGGEAPAASEQAWYEIVGVVADRPANVDRGTMYRPMAAGKIHPTSLALRVGSDPARVTGRLREITTALAPTLRLDEIFTLDEIYRGKQVGNNAGAFSLAAVTLSVLLLSAAGMYALLSFTVNQRRREIGIRSALGAQPRRLLASIFKRALGQFAAGTAGGVAVALLLHHYLPAEKVGGWSVPGVIPAAAAFMTVIALLAAVGPARRGLRVEPLEELREG